MLTLIAGSLLFFGVHSVHLVLPKTSSRVISRWGHNGWKLVYSLLAAAGLILIIVGYGSARHDAAMAYPAPSWGRTAAFVLMLPVFPFLFATYLPGHIQRWVRHPMLWATVLWALAHLSANGSWADVILFGSFLLWALADLISFLYRPQKEIPHLPPRRWNDVVSLIGGLAVYGLFLSAVHRWLTGIPLS